MPAQETPLPARLILPLVILLLAACTPRVMPAGPVTGPATLAADALVMPDGARLPLHRWLPAGPPRAVLLALHGFNDAAGNFMGQTAPAFADQGIAVYAYDQRGFGAAPHPGIWSGGETLAADAVAAATLIRARHPGLKLLLLGESMGAAVAVVAATRPVPPPVDGYILAAPALWGRAGMPALIRGLLWLATRTIPVVGFRGEAGGIRASDNEAALRRFGTDPLVLKESRVDAVHGLVDLMDAAVAAVAACCRGAAGAQVPALVLFGANDKIIPVRTARRVLRDVPPGRLRVAYYRDGWHLLLRDLGRDRVIADLLGWAADPAAPLASGAEDAAAAWLAEE